ncbi:MAG: hypothetical protein GX684_05935 [Ruminococcaceae bacterium]|nr:hypothetical protein [Oscillospiraceae bacterium]
MKFILKVLLLLTAVLGALFTIYYYNLDMKLMRSVVLPLLNKHYDARKIERYI